jgi:predicted CXXCH cytochrome family protein
VERWGSLTDPIALADRMWNHGAKMRAEMARRNIPYPQLSAAELGDLMVYLQNLPQTRNATLEFSLPSADGGSGLFEQKGCAGCHKGAMSLENKLADATLTDVASAMWNHAPLMQQAPPELSLAEMRQILGFIWGRQFFQTRGDAEHGKKAFEQKKCASCHNDASSGAPALTKPAQPYSTISMIAVLWGHGPSMLHKMQERKVGWPQLTAADMANLIAYLNSR